MARPRTSKRNSSSSSYTSTITTVAFIALCVVGVWMLNSNSKVAPQTTNHATKSTTNIAADVGVSSSTEVENTESSSKKDAPIYEDNPGDLPDDAIKSDEPKTSNDSDNKEESKDAKQIDDGDSKVDQESSSQDLKGEGSGEEQQKQGKKNKIRYLKKIQTLKTKQLIKPPMKVLILKHVTVPETEDSNPEDSTNQKERQDQQQQQQDAASSSKDLQDSQNPESKKDQQQQESTGLNENTQDSNQNEKSYEEQQQEQRQEDAGVQNSSQESQNEVSEEDEKKITQQQQQQQTSHHQEPEKESQVDSSTNQETKQDSSSGESAFPGGDNPGIPKESKESKKSWSTQAAESENQKERRKEESDGNDSMYGYTWQLCNVTAGPDYIPCLDNEKALRQLHSTGHFEHRERHCPEVGPTCLVPLAEGYKRPIAWPQSRDKIWYHNVPHTKLAEVKGHQNWVKVTGEFLTFPGGGTQFIHGALHYIDFVQQAVPDIKWGKHTRVILDVGCGVASFGGYIFERDVLTMSFAPKDEHEAQVQFALERGIPAISAVMGSQRLPFPSRVFDLIHCARCRVPWHAEGGKLLLELNRVLRPGGYFVWSATPVYQKLEEDVEIWKAMSTLTATMCWELVTIKNDKLNGIGAAIYRKPTTNNCYDQRKKNSPPMCKSDDDPNAAWYVPLQPCMHRVPVSKTERGAKWPEEWPQRLQTPPYWLNSSQMGDLW
ncbi:hypothetical protein OIU84_006068 [Salix udensis]|uniref:Methyltransferase n=1 Tax=Salix udensis TaxID=889485 RepID=A0AAD6JXJ4_9ROSI|nr:hypothetical protein OIU84_006068 [Salix udensis]KAJ6413192.1 hypothetical protein OIU84_006068 [Salix udensis]